ncbi:hypothetical protein [Poritiphilus flavus]|uniref:Uncharacterized protein n=1 Tax=Poritiphilus flavus TaxID=2697053 RepID=A0A6L9EEY6_9FLAO|nr:hypothetical protein [Poritiphilus flavus]NAS13296.1 hypothetical protein [Poritiphilus flavus]
MSLKKIKINKGFWNSDKIFGLTAMLISLVTLIIFVRQTNIMDDQSRRSVMPYLMIELSESGSEQLLKLDLVNHGVGPAIIEKVQINHKGEEYPMDFYTFLMAKAPGMDTLEFVNYSTIYKGVAIPAGGRINAFSVGSNEADYLASLKILGDLQADPSFGFDIRYKSIYEDFWKIHPETGIPIKLD